MSKKFPLKKHFGKKHCKRTEHYYNLHDSTFIIFIDHCERNWGGKNLS